MPFCPACGNQVAEAEGNRFCPRCGRDLTAPSLPAQPAAPPPPAAAPTAAPGPTPTHVGPLPPPTAPPPAPPYAGAAAPPGYAPGPYPPPAPAGPSPAAVFVRRVFTGRWEGPLLVALGPALTIVAAALAIAGVAGTALPSGTVGMATRTRAALAALVQGLGGNLRANATYTEDSVFDDSDDSGDGSSDGSSGGDEFSDGGSDGFDYSDGGSDGYDDSSGGSDGFDFSDGGSDGYDDGSDGYSTDGSDGYSSDGSDGYDSGSDGSDGTDGSDIGYTMSGGGSGSGHSHTVHASLSVLPWSVTLLWVLVLVLGLRALRRRQQAQAAAAGIPAGPGSALTAEAAAAAVRVALLAAAAVLAIGFFAEPRIELVHFTTAPFLAALWTFVLSLVTALVVLCRPALTAWLAARPGAAAAYRVLATTAIALLATLLVAGTVVFVIAAAHYHDLTGWGLTAAGLLLVNLGVSGLGLGWGAPFRVGASSGSQARHVSFGLGDLDHVWGGWSVAGTVAGGLGCALLIGVLALRRNRGRPEQFAVAGLFTLLLVILAAVSGAHTGGDSSLVGTGALTHTSVGTQVPELLGFGLLWTFGGVLVAPYVWRVFGGRVPNAPYPGAGAPSPYAPAPQGGPGRGGAYDVPGGTFGAAVPAQPAAPAGPYGPPQPPGPPGPAEPTVHDLGVVQPDRLRKQPPEPPDHR
ncbi:zinc ribbon domain-containing protein [Streptomyces sp. CA2R106]|uniref:zinc ribbon domain-containing protein n=1 Tax=Streptomyces sp. CA2R106 TaxID=3120153 RepID=UPI00300AF486